MKSIRVRSYSGLYFPVFGLNTERYGVYGVSLCIQSECGKMRTRITPNADLFYAMHWYIYSRFKSRSSHRRSSFKKRCFLFYRAPPEDCCYNNRVLFLVKNRFAMLCIKVIIDTVPTRTKKNKRCRHEWGN